MTQERIKLAFMEVLDGLPCYEISVYCDDFEEVIVDESKLPVERQFHIYGINALDVIAIRQAQSYLCIRPRERAYHIHAGIEWEDSIVKLSNQHFTLRQDGQYDLHAVIDNNLNYLQRHCEDQTTLIKSWTASKIE
ncbi:hypothetical protein DTO96_101109 [Ephemeroptericola cinctiostellae]|uniref:Uncharacterized protein n=2 Tax=Ephemeroptericola cinctiostellae TaxID=2268024 RepID=A0A345DAJ1_9BURK|nr:hypothetical protein DTO96_101109 [Ephemeroptericola cinctiostellae]